MTDAPRPEPGLSWLHRWGPYALLGLGAIVSAGTAPHLLSPSETLRAGLLTMAAFVWQVLWDRRLRELPDGTPGRVVYFAVRTVLALMLGMLNPFFSIFAVMGYLDAGRQLPRSLRRAGLLATGATLAIAQSSVPGPFPQSLVQWGVFGALLLLHSSLALFLDRFSDQAADEHRRQQATIEELANALEVNRTLHQQLLIQAQEAGRADERRRLAAELHDTLAQGLTGIITQLQASLDSTDARGWRTHLDRAAALAQHSLGEARRSVHNLTPGALEQHPSLPRALETTVVRWADASSLQIELTVTGVVEALHGEIEVVLLRITEEALANVSKHAAANRVAVTLSYFADEVTLDVRDDGRGFDPAAVPPRSAQGGFGLHGMRTRAARVAGDFAVESKPGGGTAVAVRVPLVGEIA